MSTSLIMKDVQIKTTMRYHLTPVKVAVIKKSTDDKCGRGCGKGNLIKLLVEMWIVAPTVGNGLKFPWKTKNRTTIWSSSFTPGYISKENEKKSNLKDTPCCLEQHYYVQQPIYRSNISVHQHMTS